MIKASPGGSVVKNLPVNAGATEDGGQEDTWRRQWQSTPGFLPGEFYGQRSLVGSHEVTKLDTTKELTHLSF